MNILYKMFEYLIYLLIACVLVYSLYFINPSYSQLFYYLFIGTIIIGLSGFLLFNASVFHLCKYEAIFVSLSTTWMIYIIFQYSNSSKYNDGLTVLYRAMSCLFFISILLGSEIVRNSYNRINNIIVLVALFEIIFCLFQSMGFFSTLNTSFSVTGTTLNPNITAIFLAMSSPAIFYKLYNTAKPKKQIYYVLLLLLLAILLLLKCRTAVIGFFVISFLLIEWHYKFLNRLYKISNFPVKFFLAMITIIIISITALKTYNLKSASANGRLFVWKIAGTMVKEKTFFGYGYGSFAKEYNLKQADYFKEGLGNEEEKHNAANVQMAYNEFLESTVEGGLIGFLFLFLFFGGIVVVATRNFTQIFKAESSLAIYPLSGIVSCLIMSLINFSISAIPVMFLFILYSALFLNTISKFQVKSIIIGHKVKNIAGAVVIFMGFIILLSTYSYASDKRKTSVALNYLKENNRYSALKTLGSINRKTGVSLFIEGNFFMENRDYTKALESFLEASHFLSTPELFQKIGSVYTLLNKTDKAVENFELAKNLQPNRFTPTYFLMKVYLHKNDTIKALSYANEIISMRIKIPSNKIDLYIKEAKSLVKKYNNKNNE